MSKCPNILMLASFTAISGVLPIVPTVELVKFKLPMTSKSVATLA